MLLFLCLKVCSGGYSHRDIWSLQCYTRLSSSAAWTKALVGGKASVRSTNIARSWLRGSSHLLPQVLSTCRLLCSVILLWFIKTVLRKIILFIEKGQYITPTWPLIFFLPLGKHRSMTSTGHTIWVQAGYQQNSILLIMGDKISAYSVVLVHPKHDLKGSDTFRITAPVVFWAF